MAKTIRDSICQESYVTIIYQENYMSYAGPTTPKKEKRKKEKIIWLISFGVCIDQFW